MNNSLTAKEFVALAAKENVNVLDLRDAEILTLVTRSNMRMFCTCL